MDARRDQDRVHEQALTRRSWLRGIGGAIVLGATGGLAPARNLLAQSVAARRTPLIVRSRRPEDMETPVAAFTSWITPNDRFFVRSHLHTPTIDSSQWTLAVGGAVDRPLTLRLADLRQLPAVSSVVTVECAGNGRAFFDPPVAGVQWRKGAVGTARWTGVRLGDVLRRAGIKSSARFVLMDGADRPVGTVPDFLRTLPIAKAMDPDTLLALEMNGTALPLAHGFPVRAIVPGWEGAYCVKWLTGIQAIEQQHDGFFVQTAYRYPSSPVAPGATVPPEDMEPLTGLTVKSLIVSPVEGANLPLGRVRVAGFAWAGEAQVDRVDISVDAGRSWHAARFGRDRAPHAWRAFEYDWQVTQPGSYDVLSRATDDRGRTQMQASAWNPSGYLWNAIDTVAVSVGQRRQPMAVAAADADTRLPVDDDTPLVQRSCLGCHQADLITQQRLGEAGWSRELDKMARWGANVPDAERRRLLEYFVRHFPAR